MHLLRGGGTGLNCFRFKQSNTITSFSVDYVSLVFHSSHLPQSIDTALNLLIDSFEEMLPNILSVFDALSKHYFTPLWSFIRVMWIQYHRIPIFCIFSLIRLVFICVQRIVWRRNGIWQKLNRINYGLDYESSAQVLDVRCARMAFAVDKLRSSYFLATHRSFEHPRYVLRDDCMLIEVTRDYALFVQLNKPLIEYSVSTVPFLWSTIPGETKRIIIMPITSMRRLSIDPECTPRDGGADVTFLWGSGRCGSTLIAKIIDKSDPQSLVLSEPPIFVDLMLYKKMLTPQEYQRLVEVSIRMLVKPVTGRKKLFIKPIFFVLNVAENVHKVLPNARMFYSYRKPLRTVWGHERAFSWTPFYRAVHLILLIDEWHWGQRLLGFNRNKPVDRAASATLGKGLFDVCCIAWADNYTAYVKQARHFKFPAILYERLFDNPHQFCEEILSFCGVENDRRVEQAMEMLHGDSQEGSCFSQSALRGLTVTPFTAQVKSRTDRFCDILNIPRLEYDNGGSGGGGGGEKQKPLFTFPSSSHKCQSEMDYGQGNEDGNSFITGPDQMIYEINHAGSGCSGSSGGEPESSQMGQGRAQKRPQLKPYYKPLPLQLIFSQD